MNTFLYIMMTTVFGCYVALIWIKFGVLPSISESYYRLPYKRKHLFTLFCWGFAFPAIIIGDTALMFVAGSAICFVGAAAAFKMKQDYVIHMVGAISGIILSQLYIIFDLHMWIINAVFVFLSSMLLILKIRNATWWIEILAFSSICLAMGLKIF